MAITKPGRPPRTDDPARLVVRIPGRLKDQLQFEALRTHRDMGDLVAEALRHYLPRVVKLTITRDEPRTRAPRRRL
jgi:predicted HicB family RNase H-like nuclease